jgi:hypothetical protein
MNRIPTYEFSSMNDSSSSPTDRQLAKFDQLWLETCASWPPSGFTMDPNSKLNWTIIASLKEDAWLGVVNLITEIANRWPWNIAYTAPQLHITVTGLGGSNYWAVRESGLQMIMQQATADQEPIEIKIHGLNILRNTMIVQAINVDDRLTKLVDKLSNSIKPIDTAQNFRTGIHSEVWWTSIVRLYNPIPDDLLDFVSAHRNSHLGSGLIDSVHLIETTKGFDLSKTKIINTCHLKPG